MKSPEELKAQVLDEAGCCGQCDLYRTTQDHPYGCPEAQAKILLVQELLEYTEQLESRLAQVERERDAMKHDIMIDRCESCKHGDSALDDCNAPWSPCKWEWRGVCEKNTKESNS